MLEPSRRQFLGAAAALYALPATSDPAEATSGEPEPISAGVTAMMQGPAIDVRWGLGGEFAEDWGEIELAADEDGDVFVSGRSEDSELKGDITFTLGAEEAERLAELLAEFAEKAREGERWEYP
jgi:hypothetical protein